MSTAPNNLKQLEKGEPEALLEQIPALDAILTQHRIYVRSDGMLLVPSDFQEYCSNLAWAKKLTGPKKQRSGQIIDK